MKYWKQMNEQEKEIFQAIEDSLEIVISKLPNTNNQLYNQIYVGGFIDGLYAAIDSEYDYQFGNLFFELSEKLKIKYCPLIELV